MSNMSLNITCVNVNGTEQCSQPSPPVDVGLSVGLSVFFLLVIISVAVVVYVKWRTSSLWRLHRTVRGKTEQHVQREQRAVSHQYSTMGTPQNEEGQSPLYENYRGPPPQVQTPAGEQGPESPSEPKEDFYCQSYVADDAIYYNDPSCSLAMLPEPHEGEDLYIIPDAL